MAEITPPAGREPNRKTSAVSPRATLIPLALTQFIASFAGSNMNVAITNIGDDLNTTVHGVQTAITLFLLCMAALMIPGSKLTDRWGRKRCLVAGLSVYGSGAVIAALAPSLGILILGYSAFEGVGSALMIPPVDTAGAALSASGMFFMVFGILQAGANNVLLVAFLALGAVLLLCFFLHIRSDERGGVKEPLLSTSLFRNRTSNLGLVTQNIQW